MWDQAPCHFFLSIAGPDLEGQAVHKGLPQQHCYLLPISVVRQESAEVPPFVRLSWAGVTNLGTGGKDFKQQPECWLLRLLS